MKTYISYLVIALLMAHTLTAQVKIGDNPQTLNPSSILELESTSSVLVITRVTDVQMNAITPLRGALVYNTNQNCLHYYNGDEWINICESLDNSFTVSTLAEHMRPINPNALDDTVVITETPNPDGSINYNFEVGILNGANIAPSAINGDKIQNGTVGSQDLAPRSVGLSHLQDGGANGDLFQWNGSAWTLINQADISITEVDGIIGNEVVDATDGTLTRTGNGIDIPYTLGVSPLGIGTNELADDSVTNEKINANVAGNGLNQAADGSLEVVVSDLVGDGSLSSPASTIALTGTPSGSLLENVGIDVADNAITSAKILDGTIATADIADGAITTNKISNNAINSGRIINGTIIAADLSDGAVTSAKILDGTIATIDIADNAVNIDKIGTLGAADANRVLTTNATGDPLWEDRANFASSTLNNGQIFVGNGSNVASGVPMTGDVNIDNLGVTTVQADAITTDKIAIGAVGSTDIAADAVNAATINIDVAGTGLVQNATTGALEVDVTQFGGDGSLTSTNNTISISGTPTDALFEDVQIDVANNSITSAMIIDGEVATDDIADDAVTTNKISPSTTDGQVLTTVGGNTIWRSPYHAIGKVINSTPTANILGANIIPLNTGNYRVVFSTNANSADYIIQLSVLNAAANGYVIEVVTQDIDNFTVQITDGSSTPVDATWFFTVTDF
ncbi:beta strand repeat-containing protein [Flagellimonas sp.]|uniref:beta strand repeat-containing protein n=1 Tax=Flagellimonas sp. TaxID=2058762 RepID=UPI003AB642E2